MPLDSDLVDKSIIIIIIIGPRATPQPRLPPGTDSTYST